MDLDLNLRLGLNSLENDNVTEVVADEGAHEGETSNNRGNLPTDHNASHDDNSVDPSQAETHGENGGDECSQSIQEQIEQRLEIGSVVDSLDQAYLLYCEYGRCKGFSVRKGDQSYFHKTSVIRMKEYECSCEGLTDDKRSCGKVAAYKKQMTRTDCKAKLRVTRERDGPWRVCSFNKDHNHELVPVRDSYLLRSSRNMSHAKKSVLEALTGAGIGVSRAYRFMEKECGGPQNVGFTRCDAYAHLRGVKKETKVANGDANALIQFFLKRSNHEPFFFWKVDLDDDGRLMNFFFRDSRSAVDYATFGDVLSIDTTYRTNKYNLICAPFVGINHHLHNLMFGMAFLSNETSSTFEWMFSAFLESMQWKQPKLVFSDQDRALMKGIDTVFPLAKHRLCQWHINQNAPSHFGVLNTNNVFKKLWNHCMNECETESEFETTWNEMIETYGLGDHRWFTNMYNIKHRWSSVFTNDTYCAGLHATSRSELTNKVLKELCSRSSSLYEFVLNYEQIQTDWRTRESADDTLDIGVPGQIVKNNLLLVQAAKVYTRNVYKLFEHEVVASLSMAIMESPMNYFADDLEFKVSNQTGTHRLRLVKINRHTHVANCSCSKWETNGVLCRHIIKIFLTMNIGRIPENMFLFRLTKGAKNRHVTLAESGAAIKKSSLLADMVFVNQIMRLTYDMAQTTQHSQRCRELIWERMELMQQEVRSILNTESLKEKGVPNSSQNGMTGTDPVHVLNPNIAKCRGNTNSVPKSHFQPKRGRGRRRGGGATRCPKPRSKARNTRNQNQIQEGASTRAEDNMVGQDHSLLTPPVSERHDSNVDSQMLSSTRLVETANASNHNQSRIDPTISVETNMVGQYQSSSAMRIWDQEYGWRNASHLDSHGLSSFTPD